MRLHRSARSQPPGLGIASRGLFFGLRIGREIPKTAASLPAPLLQSIPDWVRPKPEEDFDPVLIHQDMSNIRTTMWNYAGIIRSRKRLARALADLNYLSHRIERFYKQAKLSRQIIELRNSVLSASLIVSAAASNGKSLGCHFLED